MWSDTISLPVYQQLPLQLRSHYEKKDCRILFVGHLVYLSNRAFHCLG
jgi:hypothetical protein